jgi:SPP1 gp7 family putative phage head morphogenesis protein
MPQAALIDIASRHQVYLEGLKTGEIKEMSVFLKRMDKDVRAQLGGRDLTRYSRKRLEALLVRVREDISKTAVQAIDKVNTGVVQLSEYEAGFEIRSLNQVVDVDFTLPSASQLRAAVYSNPLSIANLTGDSLLQPFIKGINKRSQDRITNAIRTGYYQGETTNDILQRVRGTRARGFKDGVIGHIGRDINTIVRTALQHASSQARSEVWDENERVISKIQWVSTLDSKTSALCQGLDGRKFDKGRGPRPPIHPNCRSTTIAVLDKKFASLSEGRIRSSRIRSSRNPDGTVKTVSANQNYYGWLKNQPATFQDSVIGKQRGLLLRNGGLSTQRFQELQLNKNFRPITLDEMRKLEPVAFGKANI